MPPHSVLWPMGEHTPGKHMVLRAYLDAWLPIMGMKNPRIVFIDGFAGPGAYAGGEDGSPIIALKALREHTATGRIRAEVLHLFIEEEQPRAEHLSRLVTEMSATLPSNCKVGIETGNCVDALTRVLDRIDSEGKQLAPCFVMLDPFGISGMPMSLIGRILRNPKAELYLSFMYEAINRHKEHPVFEPHMDALFGSSDWRNGIDVPDSSTRKQFFYDLYERQLRRAGAKHVVYFELFEGNRHVYTIFFATKHHRGCDCMKAAMWKADGSGSFAFRGQRGGQMLLHLGAPDLEILRRQLASEFGGRDWISIERLTEWVQGDQTDFHSGHLKRALKGMEEDGRIEVNQATRRQRGKYPKGTCLRFRAS